VAAAAASWTAQDWLAFAAVVATVVGTLAGTVLGAALAARREQAGRAVAAAQQRGLELDEALVAADLALAQLDPTDIAVGVLADRGQGLDRTAETLARLQQDPSVTRSREALSLVRVRHPDPRVRALCEELSRDLLWLQATVTGWFVAHVVRRGDLSQVPADVLVESHADASAALATARDRRDQLARLAAEPSSTLGSVGRAAAPPGP
jgi:hypothetical protein